VKLLEGDELSIGFIAAHLAQPSRGPFFFRERCGPKTDVDRLDPRCRNPACERPCRSDEKTCAKADGANEDNVWQRLGHQPAERGRPRIGRNERQETNRDDRTEYPEGKCRQKVSRSKHSITYVWSWSHIAY
jgi:hypothetical protein